MRIPRARREKDEYQEHFSQSINSKEKVLLLEDTSDGKGTYKLVKKELVRRYGLNLENISLFLGWPGHGYSSSKDQGSFQEFLKEKAYFLPAFLKGHQWQQHEWKIFEELHKQGNFEEKLEEFIQQIQGRPLMREEEQ